jgi:hypothetical protein
MASIGPIIAVQATGLWIRFKIKRRRENSQTVSVLTENPVVGAVR